MVSYHPLGASRGIQDHLLANECGRTHSPICLVSLYEGADPAKPTAASIVASSNTTIANQVSRPPSTYVQTRNNSEMDVDLEAGQGIHPVPSLATTIAATPTTTSSPAPHQKHMHDEKAGMGGGVVGQDDEILILKRCQHLFHARCLATWFLRRKYTCPVCRVPYYRDPRIDEEAVRERELDRDARMHVALPVYPIFW
jgi:hypothetical protein